MSVPTPTAYVDADGDPSAPDDDAPWKGSVLAELRCHAEAARLLVDPIWRGAGVPRGQGEPLMVVPGLLAGDGSTVMLRQWLGRIGYQPHRAMTTMNIDCSDRALDGLERRVQRLADANGGPISLVGHSRGGILGRALATRRPDLLARVVALGSGLHDGFDISAPLATGIRALRKYHVMTTDRVNKHGCMTQQCRCAFGDASRAAFPESVEMVSIFSRGDGFSHWRSSRVPYAHNVEVAGSHLGLIANRKAYRAIGFALAGRLEELGA